MTNKLTLCRPLPARTETRNIGGGNEGNTEETGKAVVGWLDAFVMRLRQFRRQFFAWRKRRHAHRLYQQIWRATAIVLRERHGSDVAGQNRPYWDQLEACADSLEIAAITVRRGFRDEA